MAVEPMDGDEGQGAADLCRAARCAPPLNDVQHELEAILTEALAQ